MCQRKMTAPGIEDVEIQLTRQTLKQFKTRLVKTCPFTGQVVGSHNGRVTPRATTPEITLFQYGNIMNSVVPGQVIGCCQPMPTTTNNDNVIFVAQL